MANKCLNERRSNCDSYKCLQETIFHSISGIAFNCASVITYEAIPENRNNHTYKDLEKEKITGGYKYKTRYSKPFKPLDMSFNENA